MATEVGERGPLEARSLEQIGLDRAVAFAQGDECVRHRWAGRVEQRLELVDVDTDLFELRPQDLHAPPDPEPVRQLVIVQDGLVGYPQHAEQQGRGEPRAVLPRGAMEHHRVLARVGGQREHLTEHRSRPFERQQVELGDVLGLKLGELAAHHVVVEGAALGGTVEHRKIQALDTPVGQDPAGHGLMLVLAPQVHHDLNPEAVEAHQVGVGELAQMVGAEDAPPPHPPTLMTDVTAEITEVQRPFEGDASLGGHDHLVAGVVARHQVHVVPGVGVEPGHDRPALGAGVDGHAAFVGRFAHVDGHRAAPPGHDELRPIPLDLGVFDDRRPVRGDAVGSEVGARGRQGRHGQLRTRRGRNHQRYRSRAPAAQAHNRAGATPI
jgi:hypothetical protein